MSDAAAGGGGDGSHVYVLCFCCYYYYYCSCGMLMHYCLSRMYYDACVYGKLCELYHHSHGKIELRECMFRCFAHLIAVMLSLYVHSIKRLQHVVDVPLENRIRQPLRYILRQIFCATYLIYQQFSYYILLVLYTHAK